MTTSMTRDHGLELLRQMIRIRRFEERSAELYQLGKIHGFLHLYIGEEAVAAGSIPSFTNEDAIVATYREHGHALVRGTSMNQLMAELYGKAAGCARGRGGSMHFFDASRRFYGGLAIVAGGLPVAVGLALADKMQGRKRVTGCYFGDGAVAEGEFHESLNLAALWKLPVLFLCENNLYAMGTALARHQSQPDIAAKAGAYAMGADTVDGMDVLAVETATGRAAELVRNGHGPHFIEYRTYRFRAHSMYDAELYRTKDEVNDWKRRDPIATFEQTLRQARLLRDDDLQQLEAAITTELEDAVTFAEAAPWEQIEDLNKDVCTDVRRTT